MGTNIAETIQRGTTQGNMQTERTLNRMDNMGQTAARNSLQEAGMRLQIQEMVDVRANALMKGLEHYQMGLSAARKNAQKVQDMVTQVDPETGNPPTPASIPDEVKSLMADAQTKVRAAEIDRNEYIMSLTESGAAMGMLKQASFMDQEAAKNIFSQDFQDSLSPDQKDLFINRMTAIQQAEREMGEAQAAQLQATKTRDLEADAYARKKGGLRAEAEYAKPEYVSQPDRTILSEIQYSTNFSGTGKSDNWVKNSYLTDVAPFYPRWEEVEGMSSGDRALITSIIGNWKPDETKKPGEQNIESFSDVLAKYEEKMKSVDSLDPVTLDIVEALRSIVDSNEEPELRLGAFINQFKNITKPKEQKPVLRPAAESY